MPLNTKIFPADECECWPQRSVPHQCLGEAQIRFVWSRDVQLHWVPFWALGNQGLCHNNSTQPAKLSHMQTCWSKVSVSMSARSHLRVCCARSRWNGGMSLATSGGILLATHWVTLWRASVRSRTSGGLISWSNRRRIAVVSISTSIHFRIPFVFSTKSQ